MSKTLLLNHFMKKRQKNSADQRKSLLIIKNWFVQSLKDPFNTNILISLRQIQEMLYLPDKNMS